MLQWLFGSRCGRDRRVTAGEKRKDLCEESHKAKVVGAVCLWWLPAASAREADAVSCF